MDTSPTGPDFYSSPSSPASSRANWHDRDGGEFLVVLFTLYSSLLPSLKIDGRADFGQKSKFLFFQNKATKLEDEIIKCRRNLPFLDEKT